MSAFKLDRLRDVMRECGVDDGVDLEDDILDLEFTSLGYDSLAVLQIMTVVSRESGVRIADELVDELRTPRRILDFVNALPASA
jgi:act minimal PKS acyl carrier protein